MSSDYLTILQLTGPVGPKRLERTYQLSRARYERLTSRGPLRFYRQDLLTDAERAYQQLKKQLAPFSATTGKYHTVSNLRQTPSVVARCAAERGNNINTKGRVKSPVKKGTILSNETIRLKSRTLHELRRNAAAGSGGGARPADESEASNPSKESGREKALIEEEFCREVIYRLEGDMIRFDSRRELLQIAEEREIHLYRANMLIAQIVEAVRQNKLYEPSPAERRIINRDDSGGWRLKTVVAAGIVLLAVVIDVLLIRYFR